MKSFEAGAFKPSVPTPNKTATQTTLLSEIMNNISLRWFGAGISLLLFVAIISLSYSLGVSDVEKGAVPIIVSDNTPVKVRPQNPGGKQFPYQDMSVYQSLSGDDTSTSKDVTLADAPEKPTQYSPAEKVALDDATSLQNGIDDGATTDLSDTSKPVAQFAQLLKDTEQKKNDVVSNIIQKNIAQKPVEKSTPTQNKTGISKKAAPAKATEKPAQLVSLTKPVTAPKAAKKAVSKTGISLPYLQVGAYRSKTEAQKAWSKISGKYGSILKTNNHVIVRADLQNKGTFYRLRVGPYNSKNSAVDICNTLKSRSQGCMFVRQ